MSEEKRLFKAAVFGGFDKDDVLSYIESMYEAHEKEKFLVDQKYNTIQAENKENIIKVNELTEKVTELEQANSALLAKLGDETAEKLNDEKSKAEAQGLSAMLEEKNSIIETLTSKINVNIDEINELRQEVMSKNAMIEEVQVSSAQKQRELLALQAQLESSGMSEEDKAELAHMRNMLSSKNAEIENLREQYDAKASENEVLIAKVNSINEQSEDAIKQTQAYRDEIDALKKESTEIQELKEALADIEINAYKRARAIEETAKRNAETIEFNAEKQAKELEESAKRNAIHAEISARDKAEKLVLESQQKFTFVKTNLNNAYAEYMKNMVTFEKQFDEMKKYSKFISETVDTSISRLDELTLETDTNYITK